MWKLYCCNCRWHFCRLLYYLTCFPLMVHVNLLMSVLMDTAVQRVPSLFFWKRDLLQRGSIPMLVTQKQLKWTQETRWGIFVSHLCFSLFILLIIRILQALIIFLEYLCSRSRIYWCLQNDSKSVTYSETRVVRDNWALLTYYPTGSKQQIQTRGWHLNISNNFDLLCGISLVSNLPLFTVTWGCAHVREEK